jgi:hypothetical protein
MQLPGRRITLSVAGLLALVAPVATLALWPQLLEGGSTNLSARSGKSDSGPGYSASWALGYDTIPDLAKASDLVVVGTVGNHDQFAADKLLFTDFTVNVVSVVKGDVGPSIVVMQTGGIDSQGRLHEIDDDPMFADGATYLLFLRKDPNSAKYYVAGGPDGRFLVEAGQIRSLSAVYPERNIVDTGIDKIALGAASRQVDGQP